MLRVDRTCRARPQLRLQVPQPPTEPLQLGPSPRFDPAVISSLGCSDDPVVGVAPGHADLHHQTAGKTRCSRGICIEQSSVIDDISGGSSASVKRLASATDSWRATISDPAAFASTTGVTADIL